MVHNSLEFLNGTYAVVWQRKFGVKDKEGIEYDEQEKKSIRIELMSHKPTESGSCNPNVCTGPFATGKITFNTNTCKFLCLPSQASGQSHVTSFAPLKRTPRTEDKLELALASSLEKGHVIRFGFVRNELTGVSFKFLELELASDHPMSRHLIVAIMTPSLPWNTAVLYNQPLDAYTKCVPMLVRGGDGRNYGRLYNSPSSCICDDFSGTKSDKDAGIREDGKFDAGELERNLMESEAVEVKLEYVKNWVKDELDISNRRTIALKQSLDYLEPRRSAFMKEHDISEEKMRQRQAKFMERISLLEETKAQAQPDEETGLLCLSFCTEV